MEKAWVEGEKGEKALSVRDSACLWVRWGGHLADECSGGLGGGATLDERRVLWSEAKPGVQIPTLSVKGHATLWMPTCYHLGTKDGSRMDMLASEVGTV